MKTFPEELQRYAPTKGNQDYREKKEKKEEERKDEEEYVPEVYP